MHSVYHFYLVKQPNFVLCTTLFQLCFILLILLYNRFFLHTLSFLHHDLKKQCLSDTSCFNSFHYNYISFNLKIRHIEKGILHSVNLNEMIPNFHVNRTWFYNTNYTLFFEKCKQIFILHTQ